MVPRGPASGPRTERGDGDGLLWSALHQGLRRHAKRVHDPNRAEHQIVLEILGEKIRATSDLGGRRNQRVPPRETMAILDVPRAFEDAGVDGDRAPREERAHVPPRALAVEARVELLGDGDVELLENLVAEPALARCPEVR